MFRLSGYACIRPHRAGPDALGSDQGLTEFRPTDLRKIGNDNAKTGRYGKPIRKKVAPLFGCAKRTRPAASAVSTPAGSQSRRFSDFCNAQGWLGTPTYSTDQAPSGALSMERKAASQANDAFGISINTGRPAAAVVTWFVLLRKHEVSIVTSVKRVWLPVPKRRTKIKLAVRGLR